MFAGVQKSKIDSIKQKIEISAYKMAYNAERSTYAPVLFKNSIYGK